VSDGRSFRHADHGRHFIEQLLHRLLEHVVCDGAAEVGVNGTDDGHFGHGQRQERQRRRERAVHVHQVIASLAERVAHLASQADPGGDAGERAVGVYRHAVSDFNDVGIGLAWTESRRDDVHVVAARTKFACQEMDVFADPAKVRIEIFGDERNA
jgi:hypothetical protein